MKIETDRSDYEKLAILHRSGDLTPACRLHPAIGQEMRVCRSSS